MFKKILTKLEGTGSDLLRKSGNWHENIYFYRFVETSVLRFVNENFVSPTDAEKTVLIQLILSVYYEMIL